MSAVPAQAPKFYPVRAQDIDEVWPFIQNGIADALATSDGEATPEDTKRGLREGRISLLFVDSGASWCGVVFQFLQFPQFKIARVLLVFGSKMATMRAEIEAAEQWAKSQGCKYVEAWVATRSRERLFGRLGYKPTYRIIRKDL